MKRNLLFSFFIINLSYAGSSADGHSGGWLDKWLTIDVGLLYWTILTFLVLLFILKWKAWSPLMQALDARAEQIEDSLSKAEKVSAQAEKQALKNEEILNAAKKEAQLIISQAKDAGDKLKNKLVDDGKAQCDADIEKAKEQIEREKEKAISELKEQVINLSILAAEKIINKSLDSNDHAKIIDDTINEYDQN